jgi:hypothetical protein
VVSVVRITFVSADGSRREIEAKVGVSLMQNAKLAGVDAIEAEFGGLRLRLLLRLRRSGCADHRSASPPLAG